MCLPCVCVWHTAKPCVCRVPNVSARQRQRRSTPVRIGHTWLYLRRVLPKAHGKDRCSPCAVPWHTANHLDGVVRQPTTVSGSPRGTSFAVCRRVGTRRSLGSPCVLYAAHGEVVFRRVFLFRRVVLVLRTANMIFTVCPRNCTRRNFWHTANSWFPVVRSRSAGKFVVV